jgi:hypothetical protein
LSPELIFKFSSKLRKEKNSQNRLLFDIRPKRLKKKRRVRKKGEWEKKESEKKRRVRKKGEWEKKESQKKRRVMVTWACLFTKWIFCCFMNCNSLQSARCHHLLTTIDTCQCVLWHFKVWCTFSMKMWRMDTNNQTNTEYRQRPLVDCEPSLLERLFFLAPFTVINSDHIKRLHLKMCSIPYKNCKG